MHMLIPVPVSVKRITLYRKFIIAMRKRTNLFSMNNSCESKDVGVFLQTIDPAMRAEIADSVLQAKRELDNLHVRYCD